MSGPAPWTRLSARARRAVLLTSFVPPVAAVAVYTPAYLLYVRDPTEANLGLLLGSSFAVVALTVALVVRLLLILRKEPAAPVREKAGAAWLGKLLIGFLAFGAIYLSAIYAVVFLPVPDTTEARVAVNVLLWAVLIGLPVVFYKAARAFERRLKRSGTAGRSAGPRQT